MKKELKMDIAHKCRKWRIDQRISQAKLANQFGVSQASISMFESGKMWSIDLFLKYQEMGCE